MRQPLSYHWKIVWDIYKGLMHLKRTRNNLAIYRGHMIRMNFETKIIVYIATPRHPYYSYKDEFHREANLFDYEA